MRAQAWQVNFEAQSVRHIRNKRKQQSVRPRHSWISQHGFSVLTFIRACIVSSLPRLLNDVRTRPCMAKLHYIDTSEQCIPLAVKQALGLGDKLVPSSALPTYKSFYSSLHEFNVQVMRRSALGERGNSTRDPLLGLRRRFFMRTSSWMPKQADISSNVQGFLQRVNADAAMQFHLLKSTHEDTKTRIRPNISFSVSWGFKWLRSLDNPLIDCPTDKALGTALLSKSLYNDLIFRGLNASFRQISLEFAFSVVDSVKVRILDQLSELKSHRVFCQQKLDYCVCLFENWRFPLTRQLIKVHKKSLDSRLLVSGTKWFSNPIQVLIAHTLQPVVRHAESVADDTLDVVNAVHKLEDSITSASPDCVCDSCRVYSFDVEKLYPNIDQAKATASVRLALTAFYTSFPAPRWGLIVESICIFVQLVFESQISCFKPLVSFGSSIITFWLQTSGLTTGLSCATQIANIFMLSFDIEAARSLRSSLLLYKRFVDDAIVFVHPSVSLNSLLVLFNSWCPGIVITNDEGHAQGLGTSFLDLSIEITRSAINYATFRKPLNSYAYLPFISSHPSSTLRGIVSTECYRMLVTNNQ